jgi:hypothetical protein
LAVHVGNRRLRRHPAQFRILSALDDLRVRMFSGVGEIVRSPDHGAAKAALTRRL